MSALVSQLPSAVGAETDRARTLGQYAYLTVANVLL